MQIFKIVLVIIILIGVQKTDGRKEVGTDKCQSSQISRNRFRLRC